MLDAADRLVLEAEFVPLDELQRARAERLRGSQSRLRRAGAEDAPLLILSAAKRLQALDAGLAREAYLEALEAAILLGQRDAVVEIARGAPCGMADRSPRVPPSS